MDYLTLLMNLHLTPPRMVQICVVLSQNIQVREQLEDL